MFHSRIHRWTLAAFLAATTWASATLLAQAPAATTIDAQQQKLIAEAQQNASQSASGSSAIVPDKLHAEQMLVEIQQENPPGELILQMKKDKERDETALIIAGGGPVVKDKPYSALTVTDTVQTLADGNRIVRHWQNKFYRDASGRTRREETPGALQPSEKMPETKVMIFDPVAGAHYTLDPGSKTARKLVNKKMPLALIISDKDRYGQVPAQLPRLDEPRDITTEDLGARTIEGLNCTGKRTTFTIPAGAVGNERPIVITLENWYSKDIEAMVESTTNDPRNGETHYTLQNVERSDPPMSLFEVPADYTVDGEKH